MKVISSQNPATRVLNCKQQSPHRHCCRRRPKQAAPESLGRFRLFSGDYRAADGVDVDESDGGVAEFNLPCKTKLQRLSASLRRLDVGHEFPRIQLSAGRQSKSQLRRL